MKNKNSNYYLSFSFMIFLICLTCYLIFKDNSLSSIFNIIKSSSPIYIILGLSMMLIYIGCEALNIFVFMKDFKTNLSIRRSIEYSFVGFYFSAITPSSTGGQPAQVYYMAKDNVNISQSSITLLTMTMIYQIVLLGYGLIMYIFNYSFIMENIHCISFLIIYGAIANALILLALAMMIFSKSIINKFLKSAIKFLSMARIIKDSNKSIEKAEIHINEYRRCANFIKTHPMVLAKVLVITIVQLTARNLIPYFVYRAFGLNSMTAMDLISIQAILTIAVCSLPLPGAVGVSESAFMILFKVSFSSQLLVPAMILSRGISFYALIIISGIATILVHFRTLKNSKYTPPTYPDKKLSA